MFIVLVGNPFDGFTHYGTFDSFENAQKWADETIGFISDWWVAGLESTDKEESQ